MAKRRSAEAWRGLIEEWQHSGLELVQFCSEKRISPSYLKWWRWRLRITVEQKQKEYKRPEEVRQRVRARQAARRLAARKGQPKKGWIVLLDGGFYLAFGPEAKRKTGPDGMRKTENLEEARRYESEYSAYSGLKATRGVDYQKAEVIFCNDAGKLFRNVLVEID